MATGPAAARDSRSADSQGGFPRTRFMATAFCLRIGQISGSALLIEQGALVSRRCFAWCARDS